MKELVLIAFHREKKSKSEISRQFGLSRKTVRKLLNMRPDEMPGYRLKKAKKLLAIESEHACKQGYFLPGITATEGGVKPGLCATVLENNGACLQTRGSCQDYLQIAGRVVAQVFPEG